MSFVSCLVHARRGLALSMLCGLVAAVAAQAAEVGASKPTPKPRATSVRFIDAPSGENQAARDRRLKRECRGRPNAGACLGYTR